MAFFFLSGKRGTRLSEVVGAFKSLSTVEYIRLVREGRSERFAGKLWHRNYYDRIIRDAIALAKVRAYIARNPEVWLKDHSRPRQSNEAIVRAPLVGALPEDKADANTIPHSAIVGNV
jgi:hypothetical protein